MFLTGSQINNKQLVRYDAPKKASRTSSLLMIASYASLYTTALKITFLDGEIYIQVRIQYIKLVT